MSPGEAALAQTELDRARASLGDATALLDLDSLEGAASRLYYAAFHATRAALTVDGRHAKTHSGQITLFTQLHGPTPLLGQLLELRANADYSEQPFAVPASRREELVAETERFLSRCRDIVGKRLDVGPDEPDPPPDI